MPYQIEKTRKGKYRVRNPEKPTHLFSKGTTMANAERQVRKLGRAKRLRFL